MKGTDRGLSLVEVLLSVTIGSVVIAALLQGIFSGLRTLDDTNARIAGSNDTQLVAGYFTSDVASAETVSTTGTTAHGAPSVNGQNNGLLIGFWTLKTEASFTSPDEMFEGWDLSSAGPTASSRLSAAMADQAITEAGATGDRVGLSSVGTSSIGHSVSLSPTIFGTVTRRNVSSGSTAGAASLTLGKPALTQSGDVMLAQVAVSGGNAAIVTAPDGWTLVESRSSGAVVKSLIYSRTAGGSEPLNWTWTFNGSHESVGGVASYSGANAVNSHSNDINPCGGDTAVLLLSWTDRGVGGQFHAISYSFQSVAGENQLTRRHCEGGNGGTPDDEQTLARNLSASSSATAACQPVDCLREAPDSPVSVTLTLSEPAQAHETFGRIYQLRGTTRTNS